MTIINKSKKADIAITLLIIMTMVVSGAALLTFVFFNYQQAKQTIMPAAFSEFYNEQNSFEFSLQNMATEIIDNRQKNPKNPELTAEIFIAQFKTEYDIYSGNAEFPKYFEQENIKRQIAESKNYIIAIDENMLKFNLTAFNFTKNYDPLQSSGVQNMSLSKDIAFEIALKTPTS